MRNIFKIFLTDAKRLSTNVVAVVVIMGLSVIPCLYAWFNIFSNWDPYSESATSNLTVAVASDDMGIALDDTKLNIGDLIISNLKENKSINWVFTDTSEEAINGVYAGDYYAALVVNERFSEDMISFLGGDINHPVIDYYENDKKNAIAPKITGKVKTTVQSEVDKAFVSTIAKVLLEVSQYVVADNKSEGLTDTAISKLQDMDADLTTVITIIDSYISLMDTASAVMDAAKEITNELDSLKSTGSTMINAAEASTDAAESAVDTASDLTTETLNQTIGKLSLLEDMVNSLGDAKEMDMTAVNSQIDSLIQTNEALKSAFDIGTRNVKDINETVRSDVDKVDDDFNNVTADLNAIKVEANKTNTDIPATLNSVSEEIRNCKKNVEALSNTYKLSVKPQLKDTVNSVEKSLLEVQSLLNYSSHSITNLANILHSYPQMMGQGKGSLISTRAEVVQMQNSLRDLINDLQDLEDNEQYQLLVKLIETDPEILADFLVEPVEINKQEIFPMITNGDATTPFYVVLSIWFGALILVAIIKTKVKPIVGIANVKPYQEFFGRYVVFFLVGQVQTIITVLGCLLYVGIHCVHPILFYIGAALTSFAYTFLLYSLTYAFGAVGEAICVILMVIQVAGAGGTFPVEVLPKVFQVIYQYMPFAYGLGALREAVAGIYENDYLLYLLGLLVYVVIGFLVGLIGMKGKRLQEFVEEQVEKQDVIG